MTTTHASSFSLFGHAPMPVSSGAMAVVANHSTDQACPAAASAAPAHAMTAWLGGSGVTGVMGFDFISNSTKRIHPGRLEGMT